MKFRKIKIIFFVGIGGIGMSGIAELLMNLGFHIIGSDMNENDNVKRLKDLGIDIKIGHSSNNLTDADVLVYSSAVPEENPEIVKAIKKGIPVIKRAEMLGELISVKDTSIAVAGTHGKTTTSSIVGAMLTHAKKDPTLVVGGLVHNLDSNSKLGSGDIIVVEADEYDHSFLALKPTIGIVTNIELEHIDCYNNLEDVQKSFIKFCRSIPFYGALILCIDSPALQEIIPKFERPMTTYGRSRDAAYRARNLRFKEHKSTYSVFRAEENLGEIQLNVPGEHNVLNSLAAVVLGLEMGLSFKKISAGIASYKGVRRRFDIKGTHNDIMVVDDYAHHPTEIVATLLAARSGWNRRIIAVFQPHLFTRTKEFFREFSIALKNADVVLILDIYPAREKPIAGVTAKLIYNELHKFMNNKCQFVPEIDNLNEILDGIVLPNDMVITLGAGSIWRYSESYMEHLNSINFGENN